MAKSTVKKSSGSKARAGGGDKVVKASKATKAPKAVKGKSNGSVSRKDKKETPARKAAAARPKAAAVVPASAKAPSTQSKAAALTAKTDRTNRPLTQQVRNAARPGASRAAAGVPPVAPVQSVPNVLPDNGKPKKNAAGFSSRDLEHFRELLLAKRREILGDLRSMEHEALRSSGGSNLSNLPIHMADMGTDNYEQEFTLGLVEKDRQMLREINAALAKIQNGTYGLCEATGKPINKERLEYQPWARFSIEHARKLERMGRPLGSM